MLLTVFGSGSKDVLAAHKRSLCTEFMMYLLQRLLPVPLLGRTIPGCKVENNGLQNSRKQPKNSMTVVQTCDLTFADEVKLRYGDLR